VRNGIASIAVVTLWAIPWALAAEPEPAPEPDKPLMSLLKSAGVGQEMEKAGFSLFGRVQTSYTWNFDSPRSDTNALRLYDIDHDKVLLNQLAIGLERAVDAQKKQFDVGGRIEWIYGTDAGFMHANGLFDWYDGPRDPDEQFDLYQAYIDVAIPVGRGVLLRLGKASTLIGYEAIDPTQNALFSHSYMYNFAAPSTQTGILATCWLADGLSVTAGITRGWDQSVEDNNGAIDFVGSLKWEISKATSLTVTLSVGPQQDHNSGDWRNVLDAYLTHDLSDNLSLALHGTLGWESDAADDGGDAFWCGLAGYATYKFNGYLSLSGRLEWFRDDDGARTGVAANYCEATVGLGITPFPKDRFGQFLKIRPELRGDFSDERVFNDGDDKSMFTAAIDVIYQF